MDFLDPKKRRAYNIRLFIGFVLISIAIIMATTILALITAGYGINSKTGQVIQNSLVFLNSQPVSANIYINGVANGTTNARLELNSGNYNFLLKQSGYYSWENNITLYGGNVEQLVYPFLFPTKPNKSNISTLSTAPMISSATPDRHWLITSIPDQLGSFYNIDITNTKTPITTVSIPASVLGNEPGTNVLTALEWSNDNTHLLIKDTYQGGVQYIMLDRTDPASSFNINQLFPNVAFTSIKLDNKSFDKLYLFNQSTGNLVLADVGPNTTTNILSNVISYWPYSTNQILYISPESGSTSEVNASIWDINATKNYKLKDLPISSAYLLNMASYNGNLYAVVGSSSSGYTYVYQNPLDQASSSNNNLPVPYTLMVVTGTPENVTFSDSAQFIAVQSGSQFAIYDVMNDTHYRYDTGLPFGENQLATWMDGDRLDAIVGGKLTIWDFDGTNTVSFVTANSTFLPAFNTGYDAVYTLQPAVNSTTGQWSIMRNSLIANKP